MEMLRDGGQWLLVNITAITATQPTATATVLGPGLSQLSTSEGPG